MDGQRRNNESRRPQNSGAVKREVPSVRTASVRGANPQANRGLKNEQSRRRQPNGKKSSELGAKIKSFFTPKITLCFTIGAIVLLIGMCMLVSILIGVRSIEVKGCDMTSPDEIVSACGISEGSGYFSYNMGRAEDKILDSIPCVAEAEIERSLFGKVTITIGEKKAYWYTEVFGEYYALSESLEVIRRADNKKAFIERDLVRLDFPEVKSAVLGRAIEFSDDDRDCSFINEFLAEICEAELYKSGRMDQICIETKFEIFVVCDLKYKINIGKYSSVDVKLDMVEKAIRDEQFAGDSLWQIDVSNVSRIVTREDKELDLSYLLP